MSLLSNHHPWFGKPLQGIALQGAGNFICIFLLSFRRALFSMSWTAQFEGKNIPPQRSLCSLLPLKTGKAASWFYSCLMLDQSLPSENDIGNDCWQRFI